MKVFIARAEYSTGLGAYNVFGTTASGTTYSTVVLQIATSPAITSMTVLKERIVNAYLAYSATNSLGLTVSDIIFPDFNETTSTTPFPAISDVAVDAVENYLPLTPVLADAATAINGTNAKLNEVSEKQNSILAVMRAFGMITT